MTSNPTDEQLKQLVSECVSYSEIMRRCGYKSMSGGTQPRLVARVKALGLDVLHFKGRAHGRSNTQTYSLVELLVENSTYTNTGSLKRRMLKAGLLEYKCARCELSEWMGEKLVLQLDHANGNRRDNRRGNLRLLCPNCHSQTSTFAGRNMVAVAQR